MTREQVYLAIVEGWLRENRGIVFTEGAVDDLCDRIAVGSERLLAENEKLRLQLEAVLAAEIKRREANDRMKAENGQRLTAYVEEWKRRYETARLAHEECRAEAERLRAQWTESIRQLNHLQNAYDVLMARSKQMEADIERLTELQIATAARAELAQIELERLRAQKAELLATCADAAIKIERLQTWLQEKAQPTP
jgi:chromosome segregation ATPase